MIIEINDRNVHFTLLGVMIQHINTIDCEFRVTTTFVGIGRNIKYQL